MLFQCNNDGFSLPVVFHRKAQCEDKGRSLIKHCNAAAGHHRQALRVRLSTRTDCVTPLDKGATIICELCLAVNVDNLTEPPVLH